MGFSANIWAFGKCESNLGRSTGSHLIGTRSLPAGCIIISEPGEIIFRFLKIIVAFSKLGALVVMGSHLKQNSKNAFSRSNPFRQSAK